MTKREATKEGKALIKKLGKNWKLRVWQNCGHWHFAADILNGRISIHEGGKGYSCLANFDKGYCHAGDMRFSGQRSYVDPRAAVKNMFRLMEKVTRHERNVVLDLQEALKG